MIEPNCDMPWEIYLDWLQDQGNEDLRNMGMIFGLTSEFIFYFDNENKCLSGHGEAVSIQDQINGDGYFDGTAGYGDSYGSFYPCSIGCEFMDEVAIEYELIND